MTRALAAVLALLAAVAVTLWAQGALIVASIASPRRARRLLVAIDQLGNVCAGGDEDEVFSARCWRERHRQPYKSLVRAIDALFLGLLGERDHCESAWQSEQRKRERTCATNTTTV